MSGAGIQVRCLASTRIPTRDGQEKEREDGGDGEDSRGLERSDNDEANNQDLKEPGKREVEDDGASGSPSLSSLSSSTSSASPDSLQHLRHTSCVQEAQLSPDGTCIFISDYDRTFSVYPISHDLVSQPSTQSLTPYASFHSANPIWAFAVNPLFNLQDATTTTVVVSRRDSYITLHNALWDFSRDYTSTSPPTGPVNISTPLASYKLIDALTEAVIAPHSLAYTHSGTHFFCGTRDKIVLFDMQETNQPIQTMRTIPARRNKLKGGGRGFKGCVSALSLSPPSASSRDGLLAAGSWTRHVGIYDALSGAEVTSFALPGSLKPQAQHLQHVVGDGVSSLRWSPCGNYLYVAERRSDALLIYDVRSYSLALAHCIGRAALTKQKLGFDIWNAGASPYDIEAVSHEVWAGGTDGKIRVWRDPCWREGAVEPDEIVTVAGTDEPVVASLIHPTGSLAVAACGAVKMSELGEQKEQRGVQRGGETRPKIWEWGSVDILGLG
ncbi:Guanine nucleotide-binding protein negative regulator 1 [Curvularia clavata]|uniref:Guanine nucleotide-binding protein negative regulator 1 n=1 Tax=Curvularia clavata TaxID=95742 RepID=A0A9Q8Z2W3_CURCL|nr:Guanine nucleotide-binding protein negative regulator 1 [Curvularia clavata]